MFAVFKLISFFSWPSWTHPLWLCRPSPNLQHISCPLKSVRHILHQDLQPLSGAYLDLLFPKNKDEYIHLVIVVKVIKCLFDFHLDVFIFQLNEFKHSRLPFSFSSSQRILGIQSYQIHPYRSILPFSTLPPLTHWNLKPLIVWGVITFMALRNSDSSMEPDLSVSNRLNAWRRTSTCSFVNLVRFDLRLFYIQPNYTNYKKYQ